MSVIVSEPSTDTAPTEITAASTRARRRRRLGALGAATVLLTGAGMAIADAANAQTANYTCGSGGYNYDGGSLQVPSCTGSGQTNGAWVIYTAQVYEAAFDYQTGTYSWYNLYGVTLSCTTSFAYDSSTGWWDGEGCTVESYTGYSG